MYLTWVLRGTWDDDIPEASSSRSDIWSNWKVSSAHCFSNYNLRKSFRCYFSFEKKEEIVCALAINWALYSKNLRAFCNHPNIYGLLDIWSLIVWVFFSTFLSMDESSINSVCISGSVLCILVINVYGKDRCTDGQMS